MVALTIALRTLLRRKARIAMIGSLVFLGTMLIVFGETFSLSAKHFSQASIISFFTGDVILYSAKSKEKPSPFSFTTPLPVIADPEKIEAWLAADSMVAQHVPIAQNYGMLSVEKRGKKYEVPFFFYAIDPVRYRTMFPNITMRQGPFYNADSSGPAAGVVLSQFLVKEYANNYSVEFKQGDTVTLLSLNDGGSVNAYPSTIVGIYEPIYYKNIFNYINILDIKSYANLYNFTGVKTSSIPNSYNKALASESDADIFGLADGTMGSLNTGDLVAQELTGYTTIAVKLKNPAMVEPFIHAIDHQKFDIKVARWNEASGFFAYIASIIQAVIYGATFLIFLIVVFILMNTLIVSVLERTGEIGTLRAMGGEKSFITAIFLWESLLLNGTAALMGMAVSLILILIVNSGNGIMLPDIMQQYLVGGGKLGLILTPRPFIEALVLIVVVTALATIYPIRVATAITPLKAMSGK